MKKRNFTLYTLLIVLIVFLFNGLGVLENRKTAAKEKKSEARPDIILLKATEVFEKHERADVVFLHDRHAETARRMNKDCSLCHSSEKGDFSFKFKRMEDGDKAEIMEVYHENCIGCHEKISADPAMGMKHAPILCGGCHNQETSLTKSFQPAGFDKYLHYRHLKAYGGECETCHHDYEKPFYDREKEVTCRYCHKKDAEENRISMKTASHTSCLDCHMSYADSNESAGPTSCGGCHDPEEQKKTRKPETVPRLKNGQPDRLIVKAVENSPPTLERSTGFVPFDHESHEKSVESCRECHHEDIKRCNACHSLEGEREGAFISLEKAMHKVDAGSSCVGCHEKRKQRTNCAGCHYFAETSRKKSKSSCAACHVESQQEISILKSNDASAAAEALLELKRPTALRLDDMKIPEKVSIGNMSGEYGPAEIPHLKIIEMLAKEIKNDALAAFFHREKETICQGCHHNSPASENPPRCSSCHSGSHGVEDSLKPGTPGAYHIQCGGCHERMKIKHLEGCSDCHQPIEAGRKLTFESTSRRNF